MPRADAWHVCCLLLYLICPPKVIHRRGIVLISANYCMAQKQKSLGCRALRSLPKACSQTAPTNCSSADFQFQSALPGAAGLHSPGSASSLNYSSRSPVFLSGMWGMFLLSPSAAQLSSVPSPATDRPAPSLAAKSWASIGFHYRLVCSASLTTSLW